VNVVAQRFQRGDVDHVGLILELAPFPAANEIVDGSEEGGQGLYTI